MHQPHEERYRESLARLTARHNAGELDDAQFADRVARITALRDERAADADRAEHRVAAAQWRALTPAAKARARLAARTALRRI